MNAPSPARPTHKARSALVGVFVVGIAMSVGGGCASASSEPPCDSPCAQRGGMTFLELDNPGGDSWEIRIGDAPLGSIAPATRIRLEVRAQNPTRLRLDNARIGIDLGFDLALRPGVTETFVIPPQLARLVVDNPHDEPVDVAIDGITHGLAQASTATTFEGVPAGKRLVVFKSTRGPGAIRDAHRLAAGKTTTLTVPPLAAAVSPSDLPRPPDGQGLVRMRNASRLAVTLFVDGVDRGLVAPGGLTDIVLPPGTHRLEVRIEGLDAHTEHTVSLRPNQTAEWVWGEQ